MRTDYIVETFSRKPMLKRRQYYFRIKRRNGEVIAQSEGVNNKADRDMIAGPLAARLGGTLVEVEA